MKRFLYGLLAVPALALLIAPTHGVAAQDAPKAKSEKTAPSRGDTSIDFRYEGLMFVNVTVNGKGPYEFLFDSGATQSVLNERLAKELGLELHDSPGAVQGVGSAEAKLCVLDSIVMGDFKREKVLAASMNLDHMSGTLGRHMLGIVGQNVIRMLKKIEIDFSESRLHMTKYPAGEEPSNQQEEMMVRMLEGGGMPGIPGMPGMPGGPREPKKDEDGEDDFSMPLPQQNWYFDGGRATRATLLGDDKTTESAPVNRTPREGMTLTYTTGEITIPILNQKMELVPYWYLDVVLNGKNKRFMFDTGASMLIVLGTKCAADLKVPTSFGYPVKGIGKGEAKSGILESFEIGVIKETDPACTIMELPKISDQLGGGMGAMLPGIDKLDFDGIVGIPLATRFKCMIVNTADRNIQFIPYAAPADNAIAPFEGEDYVRDAAVRTWHGKSGSFGLSGDSVPLDDWKGLGLKEGGLKVESVEKDGPAAKAGIQVGDIITHLIGAEMPEMEDAHSADGNTSVRDMPGLIIWACANDPGKEVTVRVRRGEKEMDLKLSLGTYAWSGDVPARFQKK